MSLLSIAALLYFLALLLAFVDLFLPSGGALILLGIVSAVASVVFAFQQSAMAGSVMLLAVLGTIPAFAFLAVRVWPNTPIGRRVIMKPRKRSSEQDAQSRQQTEEIAALVGKVIVADADLMPSGTILVGGKSLNAVAESGFIEAGQTCEIVRYRERQFIVRLSNKSEGTRAGESVDGRVPIVDETSDDAVQARNDSVRSEDPSLLDVPAARLGLDSLDGNGENEEDVKAD